MRSSVFAVMALVACTKAGGVEIDVHAPAGVDTVRMFVGVDAVQDVSSLTVPTLAGTTTKVTTQSVFTRDPNNASDVRPYTGGTLSFEFERGDLTTLPAVIVVGYTGGVAVAAAGLKDLALNAHEIDRYPITLAPVPAAALEPTLFLWSPAATTSVTDAACAGLTIPGMSSADGGSTIFVVTEGDTDCDGFADSDPTECNPYFYMDETGTTSLSADACLVTTGNGECLIGGKQCIDGMGVVGDACVAGSTCAPSVNCACAGSGLGCVMTETPTGGDGGADTCSIGTTVTNAGCTIALPRPPTGGFGCKPTSGETNTGLSILDATEMFTGTFNNHVTLDGAMYVLDVTATCDITLVPMGSTTANKETAALLHIDLDNGSSIVVPVDFTFTGGDCAASSCQPFTSAPPAFTECVAGWGMPTNTGLIGTSPTLSGNMLLLYYINGMGTLSVAGRPDPTTGWAPAATPMELADAGSTMPLVYVALNRDATFLLTVDMASAITTYKRSSSTDVWSPPTPVASAAFVAATAIANDAAQDDAVAADTAGQLVEVAGGLSGTTVSAIGAGVSPFLADDSLNLYYSALLTVDTYGLFVSSRTSQGTPFASTGVQVREIAPSNAPIQSWLSADSHTMFYSTMAGVGSQILMVIR